MMRQVLRRAYRSSVRDVVATIRSRFTAQEDSSPSHTPAALSETFLRSSEYAELMSRHLPFDGSYDLHEAQNETRNYRFRHQTAAQRLGVFRWRGIQKNLDILLPLLTLPASKVVDFGGAGGPLGFGALVVDKLEKDAWGRPVQLHSLADVAEGADVVFSSHALEHIVELDDILRDMRRCLKVGGHLILHVPSFHCERWRAGIHSNRRYSDHVWTFGIGPQPHALDCQNYVDIAQKVRESFELLSAEYCGDDSIFMLSRRRQ